jgi:hypothetical protein
LNIFQRPKIGVILVLLAVAGLFAGLAGCGGKGGESATPTASITAASPTATATKKAAASPAVKTTATTAVKSATPTAVPKLNDISFSLTLDKGQEYTESTTPIFLRSDQVLHLNWLVVKGGNHFHLIFTLPNGSTIAVRTDGTLAAYSSANSVAEDLTKSGSLVLRPSDNDWEDGYYIFHSFIGSGDTAVSIKLLYWIEG